VDEEHSPIQHTLVLRRVEAERNVARFYALMIEHDPFGRTVLARNGSRMGRQGRE
jgi:predicted DNA-binding WGR domain protein